MAKDFTSVKETLIKNNEDNIRIVGEKIANGFVKTTPEKIIAQSILHSSEDVLDNIEDATIIEIGYLTNTILKQIENKFNQDSNSYYLDFECFITSLIDNSNAIKTGLGLSLEDFTCFKGKLPTDPLVQDLFKQNINNQFKTNIPLNEEVQKTREAWQSAPDDDEYAKALAFINLRDMQKNNGNLKTGPSTYVFLTNNPAYQKAKKITEMARVRKN